MSARTRSILSAAQMRQAEARAFRRASSFTYMRRAGDAVAHLVEQRFPQQPRVVVVCGEGNNGGDGYIAAQKLATRGLEVFVLPLGKSRGADAQRACELCQLPRIGMRELDACIEKAKAAEELLLIDAMFAIGLSRPLAGTALEVARLVRRARASNRAFVLAVDLPSGLFADSPCVEEDGVVAADLTLCFFRKKPAHVLLPARAFCGEVLCADIGFEEEDAPADDIVENELALFAHAAFFQPLSPDTHKYRRGSVVVLRSQMTGAALLAADAATRSGVGIVRLISDAPSSPSPLPLPLQAQPSVGCPSLSLPASVVEDSRGWQEVQASMQAEAKKQKSSRRENTAFAYGFGAPPTQETLAVVRSLTALQRPLVLDAGALRAMGLVATPDLFASFRSPVVLTPHAAEFRALFACEPSLWEEHSPFVRVRRAARLAHATVVLKGGDTLVACPDGRLSVLTQSTPCLATAGSGDVLAGFLAGFLAQEKDAFLAASAAVWLHAQAGLALEKTRERTTRADDLAEAMAQQFAARLLHMELAKSSSPLR